MGLQLRVRKTADGSSRTWLFRYKWRKEEWVRVTLGHFPALPLADARASAIKLRRALADGIDPRRARASRRIATVTHDAAPAPHTMGHLAEEFMERYVRPNRKRPEDAQWLLSRDILREWSDRDARSITPREVVDLLDSIVDRGAPVLANRTARILHQMYRFGVQRHLVDSSPVLLLTPPGGKEKSRDRVLSDDELKVFLADPEACTRHAKLTHTVMVVLLTGVRSGELLLAEWKEFGFHEKTWTVPKEHDKLGLGHIVPLTGSAIQHLMALRALAGRSPFVFPSRRDPALQAGPRELGRRLNRCMGRFKRRGIEKWTLHDLRRTCRTGLPRLGIPKDIAERVLHHAQPGSAGVYDRYEYLIEKRAALEKWAVHIEALCDSKDKS